ncbi:MAG: thioredoxin family protein [Planctomycetes bacterium]|nr:thioredoxin family protein [Planctomycetota bacterium]
MRYQYLMMAVLIAVGIKTSIAQERGPWAADVQSAFEQASQQNKPVLLHFWSRTCRPCRELETYVFPSPAFSRAVAANCIPVKVNVEEQQALARRYGIRQIPTDVIVSSSGEEILRTPSPRKVNDYIALMRQVASRSAIHRQSELQQLSQIARQGQMPFQPNQAPFRNVNQTVSHNFNGGGTFEPSGGGFHPIGRNTNPAQSGVMNRLNPGLNNNPPSWKNQSFGREPVQPVDHNFVLEHANRQPAARQQNPPMGLDGFCPVTLLEKRAWKKGNVRWGIRHRGRTYLFAGQQELQRFWADPDRYSPALSGYDPVLLLEKSQWISGNRQFGVFYQNPDTQRTHIYLFADAATRKQFETSPEAYARGVHQAMMQNAGRSRPN